MGAIPHIINHQQNIAVGQQLRESGRSSLHTGESWPFAAEGVNQIFNAAGQIARIFAERHPQNAVVKSILNTLVMTKRFGPEPSGFCRTHRRHAARQ